MDAPKRKAKGRGVLRVPQGFGFFQLFLGIRA